MRSFNDIVGLAALKRVWLNVQERWTQEHAFLHVFAFAAYCLKSCLYSKKIVFDFVFIARR